MKKITAILVFFTAGFCLYAQNLAWEIKFLKGNPQESVSIARPISMETGETFLITVKPEADCFCYVVYNDSTHQISVLKNVPISGGVEINIGPYKLEDPVGTETFYVIMSLERQRKLENLIQTFNNSANSRQDASNLSDEVANLQKTASSLGEPASTFIASGGTTRGPKIYTTRFTDKAMYVRAITIRH